MAGSQRGKHKQNMAFENFTNLKKARQSKDFSFSFFLDFL